MRRLIVPFAIVLALTTGAWFGQAITFFASPVAFEAYSVGGEDTVHRFYDAVQWFFDTGDATAVRAIVAEDFVDHAIRPGTEPTQDGLVRYLGLLRQTFHDLRVEPREVVAQNDRVIALVDVTWSEARLFLGMPLAGVIPWGRLDMFSVAADRIVAHWADSSGSGVADSIASCVFTVPHGLDFAPALARRTYKPGTSDWELPTWGPAVVLVEIGNVIVDVDANVLVTVVRSTSDTLGEAGMDDAIATFGPVLLGPGDLLIVGDPAKIETRNESDDPAEVLMLSLGVPKWARSSDGMRSATPLGIGVQSLAGGPSTSSVEGQVHVAIGRAVLSPGAGLATHVVDGHELMLVESGSVALTVGGGTAWTRQPNQTATAVDGAGTLQPDTGLSVPAGATVSYRNDGRDAVSLLFVTIVPTSVPDH